MRYSRDHVRHCVVHTVTNLGGGAHLYSYDFRVNLTFSIQTNPSGVSPKQILGEEYSRYPVRKPVPLEQGIPTPILAYSAPPHRPGQLRPPLLRRSRPPRAPARLLRDAHRARPAWPRPLRHWRVLLTSQDCQRALPNLPVRGPPPARGHPRALPRRHLSHCANLCDFSAHARPRSAWKRR